MIPAAPPHPRRLRVVIVDDHPMMRLGLAQFLGGEPDFDVVAEAGDAASALAAVGRLAPHVVLLDISLPGRSGLDLAKDLRARFPEVRILFHSMHDSKLFEERARRVGAHGYVPKSETGTTLLAALRRLASAKPNEDPSMRNRPNQRMRHPVPASFESPIASLTDREFEVFRLIGQGCINREIARQLHISVRTVEAHREHLRQKLSATTATALNLLAVRWALTEELQ